MILVMTFYYSVYTVNDTGYFIIQCIQLMILAMTYYYSVYTVNDTGYDLLYSGYVLFSVYS